MYETKDFYINKKQLRIELKHFLTVGSGMSEPYF